MIFPPCLSAGMRIADRREGRYTSLEFEIFMELPKIFSKTRNHSLGHPLYNGQHTHNQPNVMGGTPIDVHNSRLTTL